MGKHSDVKEAVKTSPQQDQKGGCGMVGWTWQRYPHVARVESPSTTALICCAEPPHKRKQETLPVSEVALKL